MSKHIPILFSTDMVNAILQGRKTQTRRVKGLKTMNAAPDTYKYLGRNHQHHQLHLFGLKAGEGILEKKLIECPYGKPGDILWVRETFYRCIDSTKNVRYLYRSNYFNDIEVSVRWKPSIHMPKEACRLFLRITNIRCERLQDISEDDAKAEGVDRYNFKTCDQVLYKDYSPPEDCDLWQFHAKGSFFSLWHKINGKESLSANPWVWVIEFERIDKPANWPNV
jgi:hypothetical protein